LFSGTQADIVEIKSINVSPDPPQPGQNLTVNVVAYAHEVVEVRCLFYRTSFVHMFTPLLQEGAYVDVTVKLGLIKLLHKQFDVCEEACVSSPDCLPTPEFNTTRRRKSDVDIKCPIQEGPYNVSQTVALPREIPPGII
jgi:hypothetical protein